MLIDLTGKKIVTKMTGGTCEFHKKNPGVPWAGCTCWGGYSQTVEEDPNPPQPCPHCNGTGRVK